MKSKCVMRQSYDLPPLTLLFFSFVVAAAYLACPAFALNSEAISAEKNTPVYQMPVKDAEILRREGGTSEKNGAANRGLTRGLTRGGNRALSRGLTRGDNRGLSRGLTRGDNRGLTRGDNRALTRGLTRALTRGDNRALTRSLTRGEERGLTRMENTGNESISVPIPSRMVPFASERTGLSLSSQPVFRWYISDPWPGKMEFTLNQVGAADPILETYVDGPDQAGVYRFSLADYKVSLRPNVEYEWFLVIVPDPNERSADFLASATIKYVPPPDALSKHFGDTPEDRLYFVYAQTGYWYDMIENLSRQIDAAPNDHALRSHRVALLKQVNLPLAAAYDSKMISAR
ncbi:MAG: hypothetical protein B6245_04305 [Desulfobacteraceae bacterium 4572_88]|nr:MAG: hypothetical protein B6245_04305 [Desulfobacteraceae bacterium 4572_88]